MSENKNPIPLSHYIGAGIFVLVSVVGAAAIILATIYLTLHNQPPSLSTHLAQ